MKELDWGIFCLFFSLSPFRSSCELALRHLLKLFLLSLLCGEGFHDSWPPEGCSLPYHFSLPSGIFTWSKRVGSEANKDMWRDSFVVKLSGMSGCFWIQHCAFCSAAEHKEVRLVIWLKENKENQIDKQNSRLYNTRHSVPFILFIS